MYKRKCGLTKFKSGCVTKGNALSGVTTSRTKDCVVFSGNEYITFGLVHVAAPKVIGKFLCLAGCGAIDDGTEPKQFVVGDVARIGDGDILREKSRDGNSKRTLLNLDLLFRW